MDGGRVGQRPVRRREEGEAVLGIQGLQAAAGMNGKQGRRDFFYMVRFQSRSNVRSKRLKRYEDFFVIYRVIFFDLDHVFIQCYLQKTWRVDSRLVLLSRLLVHQKISYPHLKFIQVYLQKTWRVYSRMVLIVYVAGTPKLF
jgi:hypothetical protein